MRYPVVATLLALASVGQASEGLLGLSLRGGLSSPADGDTREYATDIGYNAGLRFALPLPALLGSASSVDLEGFQAKDGNDHINYLGLTYNEQARFGLGPVGVYAGAGVGAYRLGVEHDYSRRIDLGSSLFVTRSEDRNRHGLRAGGRVMAGVELPLGLFVEVSVVVTGKVDGVNGNTANLAVGIAF